MRTSAVCRLLLALLLSCMAISVGAAQSKVAKPAAAGIGDPAKLEGKVLNKVHPDDVRVLGILGFSLINEAQAKKERLPLAQLTLSGLAVKAYNEKDYETAFRYATRFIFLRHGVELNDDTEVASSLDIKLDRKLVDAAEGLTAIVQPLFTSGKPLAGTYTARLSLHRPGGEQVAALPSVSLKELAEVRVTVPVEKLPQGTYAIRYELLSPTNKSLARCERTFLLREGVRKTVQAVTSKLRAAGPPKTIHDRTALESAEYLTDLFERSMKEYVTTSSGAAHPIVIRLRGLDPGRSVGEPFDYDRDVRLAARLGELLAQGKSPLSVLTGDLHLAYRSSVDQTLQPFRVFVPETYDPTKKYPLIVGLHGATGDENTYMDRYLLPGSEVSLFKKLGQERGYLLVSPNGRGPFGGYTGDSEKDVLEVLDRVQQLYSVDPRQTFLTGHSMGAVGTWLVGFRHPERFAGLAPLAGRPQNLKDIALAKAPTLPVLMHHGAKDTIATVQAARELVKVAEKDLKHFKYIETQDDHFVIGVTSMPAIFDFFDSLRKQQANEP